MTTRAGLAFALLVCVSACGPVAILDDAGSEGGGSAGGGSAGGASAGGGSAGGGSAGGGSAGGGSVGGGSVGGGSAGGGSAGGGSAGGGSAGGGSEGGGSAGGSAGGAGGGTGNSPVTFSYKPSWAGVTAVTVVGGFGQSNDWTTPLLSLIDDGTGTWAGTAMLPTGSYPYLFKVTGDAQGSGSRYVIDPGNSASAACPTASPTYSANMNPCATLTVPQGAADTTFAITGQVNVDGAGAAGYLVELERDETATHHFFANRATTNAAGAFALRAATGKWRLQVLYPTFQTTTDAQRDGRTLAAQRRMISNGFALNADLVVATPEMAFHGYGAMHPADGGSFALPTIFSFTRAPWASGVRLAIYGSKDGGSNNIGDPWFASAYFAGGTSTFDGGFPTAMALEPAARPGERYFWGTWHNTAPDGGFSWTAESMVFPLSFQ